MNNLFIICLNNLFILYYCCILHILLFSQLIKLNFCLFCLKIFSFPNIHHYLPFPNPLVHPGNLASSQTAFSVPIKEWNSSFEKCLSDLAWTATNSITTHKIMLKSGDIFATVLLFYQNWVIMVWSKSFSIYSNFWKFLNMLIELHAKLIEF